jgi:thiol-disulfide isomerase/thioredoxin
MKLALNGMTLAASVWTVLTLCSIESWSQGPTSTVAPQRVPSPSTAVRPRTVKFPDVPSGIAETEIELVNGRGLRLSRQRRMVILVDLWATWCTPCRDQMPRYQELWNQYHARGFEIVALDVGGSGGARESNDAINRFAKQSGIKFLLGHSPPELSSEFFRLSRRPSIPQAIIIGRDGRLRGVFTGGGAEHDKRLLETLTTALAE